MLKKLTNLQWWGIGGMITTVGAGVVYGFAIANRVPPALVYSAHGLVVVVLGYLSTKITIGKLPTPPPEEPEE
jgi:putative Ca2+/H+ antiporter (TMEM165/GDT1 family)